MLATLSTAADSFAGGDLGDPPETIPNAAENGREVSVLDDIIEYVSD
jgi:hypothetical protein